MSGKKKISTKLSSQLSPHISSHLSSELSSQPKNSSSLSRAESETILAFLLKKDRTFIIAHPEYKLTPRLKRRYQDLCHKRQTGWPLAYVLKEQGFYGLNLQVNPNVLIPRPETELIIDCIIEKTTKNNLPNKSGINFIDLGTGSGAIIISLANELRKRNEDIYSHSAFFGLDISVAALKVARANARLHNLTGKIKFRRSNLLNGLSNNLLSKRPLVIAANLPYLRPAEIKREKSLAYEPELALLGGPDGLEIYRRLFKELVCKDFSSLLLICEINPAQASDIKKLAASAFATRRPEINILKDFRKKKRFLLLEIF